MSGGVSITSGGGNSIDMDLIVAGGQPLLDRLADYKAQRDAAADAMARLALGKEVYEARDELARARGAFEAEKKEHAAKFEGYIASIKADVDIWKRETIAKHMADSEAAAAARAEAERLLGEAQAEHQAAAQERAAIAADRAKLDETKKAVSAAQNLLGAL
jgi:hypothetical protein